MNSDKVNPDYYQGDAVMRIIEDFHLDFCKGNALKYLLRAGAKTSETEVEDLRKAEWYIARRIKQKEAEKKAV